jgi:hypothetical protein
MEPHQMQEWVASPQVPVVEEVVAGAGLVGVAWLLVEEPDVQEEIV